MDLPIPDVPDSPAQRHHDRYRVRRALTASLLAVLLILLLHALTGQLDVAAWTVRPWLPDGLLGVLTAPLLHGSWEHVLSNSAAIAFLGTLAGSVSPRASLRALPLIWLGSGLAAWTLGHPGEHHLGASGVTHGLMLMTFVLGLLRRERAAVAAAMVAFLLYGGMLVTVFPQEPGISWQSHLGGALAGALAAVLFRGSDPQTPRRVFAYELEEDHEDEAKMPANDRTSPAESPAGTLHQCDPFLL